MFDNTPLAERLFLLQWPLGYGDPPPDPLIVKGMGRFDETHGYDERDRANISTLVPGASYSYSHISERHTVTRLTGLPQFDI